MGARMQPESCHVGAEGLDMEHMHGQVVAQGRRLQLALPPRQGKRYAAGSFTMLTGRTVSTAQRGTAVWQTASPPPGIPSSAQRICPPPEARPL